MEDVLTGELALALGRVEVGSRIDHVQLRRGSETVDDQLGVLASESSDLHDAADSGCFEHWGDGDLPQPKHATDWLPRIRSG